MSDYISREDALNFEMEIEADPEEIQAITKGMALYGEYIKSIPAADVVERKHGKWIKADDGFDESWVCSECMAEYVSVDADFIDYAHYCPNCGAYMRGDPDV